MMRALGVVVACGFVAMIVACPPQLPVKADGCIFNQVCDHVTCICVGAGEGEGEGEGNGEGEGEGDFGCPVCSHA